MYLFIRHHLLFIISTVVFMSLNIFENLLQFTIGRKPESEKILNITKPNKKDWIKIITVTIIFAMLQGLLTVFFNNIYKP